MRAEHRNRGKRVQQQWCCTRSLYPLDENIYLNQRRPCVCVRWCMLLLASLNVCSSSGQTSSPSTRCSVAISTWIADGTNNLHLVGTAIRIPPRTVCHRAKGWTVWGTAVDFRIFRHRVDVRFGSTLDWWQVATRRSSVHRCREKEWNQK